MAGETELTTLLRSMSPKLLEDTFVFVSLNKGTYVDYIDLTPKAMFQEDEGMTLVIPTAAAEGRGLPFESTFRCITLSVHSSLEAVGLTAAFASQLAINGISANVMAGFYHDHIFVPTNQAEQAMRALMELSSD